MIKKLRSFHTENFFLFKMDNTLWSYPILINRDYLHNALIFLKLSWYSRNIANWDKI